MWRSERVVMTGVLAGLGASAALLALAPLAMPADYSLLSHTTSESAAQGVEQAWIVRLGFVLFGLCVLVLTVTRRRAWAWAAVLHGAFGLSMVAVGVFSSRPWAPGVAYDQTEDLLHSVAASAVGIAFALGVIAMLLRGSPPGRRRRWPLDVAAVLASVLVPLAMLALPELDGMLQRSMFVIAYVWYATEGQRAGADLRTRSQGSDVRTGNRLGSYLSG